MSSHREKSNLLIVGNDPLTNFIYKQIVALFGRVIWSKTEEIADLALCIDQNKVFIEGSEVHGFLHLDLTKSNYSSAYTGKDQYFSNTEILGILMYLFKDPGIFKVNQYTPQSLFNGATWPYWRLYFIENSIPLSSLHFGNNGYDELTEAGISWYSYSTTNQHINYNPDLGKNLCVPNGRSRECQAYNYVYGQILTDHGLSQPVHQATDLLYSRQINLGTFVLDENQQILFFEPTVQNLEEDSIPKIASIIIDRLNEFIDSR